MSDSASNAALIQEAFDTALGHQQAGRWTQAEDLYRVILQIDPQHAHANYNLALLALQLKQVANALHHLKIALAANPHESKFWLVYIETLAAAGEIEAAREVLQLSKQHGMALNSEAIARFEPVQSAPTATLPTLPPPPPPPPEARKLPAPAELQALNAAFQMRDYDKLEQLAQTLTQKYPYAIEGWKALSLAYYHRNRFDLALAPTQKMLELSPEDAQMHANLGLILWRLRRLDEAEQCFLHALARDPNASDTHTNLGNVRKDQGRIDDAIACYRQAIALDPKQAVAHSNLGVLLIDKQDFRNAENCFRTALRLDPNNPYALRNLSTVLTKLGHLGEAESVIRQAIAVEPDNTLAYDLLLFILNYTHIDKSREARELAERYGQVIAKKRSLLYRDWRCTRAPQPQKLRVGMIAGDFNNHPVGLFVESLVRNLNPEQIELFAYVHMPEQKYDAVTQRLHSSFAAWKSIYRLDDKDAAALIHNDGVHVLLDLSGHTTDNRLPVFAYKPAPVQASWLGYFATTGVAEMDYLIGDPYLCPLEEEDHFTETVWRLPQTWLAFTPPQEAIAVAPLPAETQGHITSTSTSNTTITFGCFNNLNKMNEAVVALWSQLLLRLPTARLFLKAPQLRDSEVQAQTQARFAAHGISADRLLLEGPAPRDEYLQAYARVDIALDPFPYPGGATSVDALWMGVPVLTLRGNRFLAHLGESVAHNAGLPNWIAADKDDYLAKAITFAAPSNLPALAALRSGLRTRLQASPLLDTQGFAQGFTEALWDMWRKWESGEAHKHTPAALPKTPATPKPAKVAQAPQTEIARLQRLFQQRRFAELEKHGQAVARKYPKAVAGWRALSLARYHSGQLEAALQATQTLIELAPDDAATHALQGLVLINLKRVEEAAPCLQQAIALDPKSTDPRINLAYIYRQQGRLDEAIACYQAAITINPALAAAHANLGVILLERRELRAAESSFRSALSLAPANTTALLGLASTLVKLGLLDEAENLSRRLIKLEPDNAAAYDTLLFLLNYHNATYSQEAYDLALRYGAIVARKASSPYAAWQCDMAPQRLRIGLVSGDLYNHPVGYFLASLLEALNPDRIEIVAYANRPERRNDAMSERLRARCAVWRTIDTLDDATVAAQIHADGIHVLLDLAGHTGNNRLPVFAYKPAPIQAAWLGYFATTGVAEIDYLIGDPQVCPPAEENHFSETIWRLPETYLCFTPPDATIAVSELPALQNGFVTFGCFNNVGKLTAEVIATWSRILQQVPNSRLLLKARQLGDAAMCAQMRARFAAHGIASEQLLLEGPTPRADYLQAYQRLDIVLDPFPYPGGTTTVEALWMSVPVLTLRGNHMLSHAGENILGNVGLSEWIAADETDYVAKAVAFATGHGSLGGLAALRSRLRAQVLASPMFDSPRFARHFEDALWGMWAAWKAQRISA